MKLDPGMHIGMHLVSFGKSGVTGYPPNRKSTRNPTDLFPRIADLKAGKE
jgi:hypothetical protein